MEVALGELARRIGAELRGDAASTVGRVRPIEAAGTGDLSFLYDRKYRKFLRITRATAVIVASCDADDCPTNALVASDPYIAYAKALEQLYPVRPVRPGVHPSAVVAEDSFVDASAYIGPHAIIESNAVISAGVYVGSGCVIAANARIADYARLSARVVICRDVEIGRRTVIAPGAVVGAEGFGFVREFGRWTKVPQIGRVIVGDDVEIGANTTIDRGAHIDTVIENGVKLDNQIQIGHNVRIGENTAIAASVAIGGSAIIGRRCIIAGGAGIAGHIKVADDVTITAMSLVTKSISKPGVYASGWPAKSANVWRRQVGRFNRVLRP